jgi:hypothetical protein
MHTHSHTHTHTNTHTHIHTDTYTQRVVQTLLSGVCPYHVLLEVGRTTARQASSQARQQPGKVAARLQVSYLVMEPGTRAPNSRWDLS